MSYTAKSIVIDIATNHGGGSFCLREMDFYLDGNKFYAYYGAEYLYTTYGSQWNTTNYAHKNAFDTHLSLYGAQSGNGWLAVTGAKRIIIVFDDPLEFDEIRIYNSHNAGGETDRGIKDVVITATEDTYTNTTYQATVSNGVDVFDGIFLEHAASDTPSEQVLTLIPTGTGAITWPLSAIEATGFTGDGNVGDGTVTWLLPEIEAAGGHDHGDITWLLPTIEASGTCTGGEGAVTLPIQTIAAEGACSGAIGDVTFPVFTLHADDDVIIGEISFPALEVTASGSAFGGTGAVDWPAIDADADGLTTTVGGLDSFFPLPQVLGTGIVSILGTCAITFPALKVATTGLLGRTGNSALQFPVLQLAGTAGGNLSGSPTITMPMLQVYGEGRAEAQTETILRHSRY